MSVLIGKIGKNSLFQEGVLGVLLLALVIVPFMSFAGGSHKIYVDAHASGSEDGSSAHPYQTISEALKHADDGDEIHILPGKYEDNLDIPKGVELYGSGKDEVIIEAGKRSRSVAIMRHKSKIDGVTLKGGKYGVWVKKDARVSIVNCDIRKNDEDGIYAESASVSDKYALNISDSGIEYNGRNGIFSQKRRVVLVNNEIQQNKSDGLELAAGSSSWMDDNVVSKNGGSGMRLTLDGSNIYVASKNSIHSNGREGMEVNAFGGQGTINVKKSRIVENNRYGIARVQRSNFSSSLWNGLVVEGNNTFFGNGFGDVSSVIRGF